MSGPPSGISDLAQRLALRPSDWIAVLVAEPARVAEVAAELAVHGEIWTRSTIRVVAASEPEELVQALAQPGIIVWHGVDAWPPDFLRELDFARSRLYRADTVGLVCTEPSWADLASRAPNLASWFGGCVTRLDPEGSVLTPLALESRLAGLRARFGHSDQEVIGLAEKGELPREPEYAEWLLLLGRGDLVAR